MAITVVEHDGPGVQPGMEITIQSNSDPETFERASIASIIPEADGVTYTINLKGPLANDYPDGALLYRSKGDSVLGRFIFAAKRGDFGAETYTPDFPPTGAGQCTAFSPDGRYLAVGCSAYPYLIIYKRTGDAFTRMPDPDVLPTGTVQALAFSPEGTYLAVGSQGSPYLSIYKRVGDSFMKLPNPNSLPAKTVYGTAFSPGGNLLAVASDGNPNVILYTYDEDTFTTLENPSSLPAGTGRCVAFSPDGTYLALGNEYSTNVSLYIYRYSNSTVTYLTSLTGFGGAIYGAAFSPDGTYLAVAPRSTSNFALYKRSGDEFVKLPNPSTLPTGYIYGVAFSPDGNYLAFTHSSSPYVTIYKREFDSFIKLPDPPVRPAGSAYYSPSFSPRGDFLAVAHYNSPYLTIYSTGFTLTPMKQIDVRYNIATLNPFSSIVAWVERERQAPYTLKAAVSIHANEENYVTMEEKVALIDDTCEEHQYTAEGGPATRATLRLTAVKEDYDVIASLRKITGAVGE